MLAIMEVGFAAQNLLLQAVDLGLGAVPAGSAMIGIGRPVRPDSRRRPTAAGRRASRRAASIRVRDRVSAMG